MTFFLAPPILMTILLYFYWNRHEAVDKSDVYAAIFMLIYLVALWQIETVIPQTPYVGGLFIGLPLFAFGALLWSEMNSTMPVKVTKMFGWLGMLVTMAISQRTPVTAFNFLEIYLIIENRS